MMQAIENIYEIEKEILNKSDIYPSITVRDNLKRLLLVSINELWPINWKRKIVFYAVKWLL